MRTHYEGAFPGILGNSHHVLGASYMQINSLHSLCHLILLIKPVRLAIIICFISKETEL